MSKGPLEGLRVLMLSGDGHALVPESGVHKRLLLQAEKVEWLEVFVRTARPDNILLSRWGRVRGFSGSKAVAAYSMWRAARRISTGFQIVTAQDPFFLGFLGWVLARSCGAKLQLQVHTNLLSPEYRQASFANRVRFALASVMLRRADCIRAVSDTIALSVRRIGVAAPVSVLPVFIDIAALEGVPAANLRAAYPHFSHYILIAARLEKEKRIGPLLDAIKEILEDIPTAALFIAGEGMQRPMLEAHVQQIGIGKNVVFLGYRNDIAALYKFVDLVLAATAGYEGYGATTVEALACGVPVISPDVGIARAAGAHIANPQNIAPIGVKILQSGERSSLRPAILQTREEWVQAWLNSLKSCTPTLQ